MNRFLPFLLISTLLASRCIGQEIDTQFGIEGEVCVGQGTQHWSGWRVPGLIKNQDLLYIIHYGTDTLRIKVVNEFGETQGEFGEQGLLELPFNDNGSWPLRSNRSFAEFFDEQLFVWNISTDNFHDGVMSEVDILRLNSLTGEVDQDFGINGHLNIVLPESDRDSLLGFGFRSATKIGNHIWISAAVNDYDTYLVRIDENGDQFAIWSTDGEGGVSELDILGNNYSSERLSNLTNLNGKLCAVVSCKDQNNLTRAFLVSLDNSLETTNDFQGSGILEISPGEGYETDYYYNIPQLAVWNNFIYIYDSYILRKVYSELGAYDENWNVQLGTENAKEVCFNPIFDAAGRIYTPGYLLYPSQLTRSLSSGELDNSFGSTGVFNDFQIVSSPVMKIVDIVYSDNLYLYALFYGSETSESTDAIYLQKYIYNTTDITGINDQSGRCFPNPATNHIRFDGEWDSCEIYDMIGCLINKSDQNGSSNLDCTSWNSGVYTVVFKKADITTVCKVIKE